MKKLKITKWWKMPWGNAPRVVQIAKTQEVGTFPVEEFQETWNRAEIPGAWKSRLYVQFTPDYSFWGKVKHKLRFWKMKLRLSWQFKKWFR